MNEVLIHYNIYKIGKAKIIHHYLSVSSHYYSFFGFIRYGNKKILPKKLFTRNQTIEVQYKSLSYPLNEKITHKTIDSGTFLIWKSELVKKIRTNTKDGIELKRILVS